MGSSLVEFALLVVLIAVVAIPSMSFFGGMLECRFYVFADPIGTGVEGSLGNNLYSDLKTKCRSRGAW